MSNITSNNSSSSTSEEELKFNSFSFEHFLIIIFIAAALIFLSFSLIQLRIRIRNNMVDRIPRKIMPFLRPGDLSNKQRTTILNGIVNSKHIQSQIQPVVGDSPIGHLGWGAPDSEYPNTHFKTFISKSYIVLESVATHFNASLKRSPNTCIRDYVELLLDRCEFLDEKLAYLYIDTYEKARFSEDEFTEQEYTHFKENFGTLIQSFEPEASSLSFIKKFQ
ncbi:hypothetical protein DLAC_04927 [Tieghemostelium lacteum]|uniref:Defect at low temperature protein 1 n=1 Tax=Tieghemostelium lacteum TaxID=361077 RepID=A0A151ZI15_TIELA|nr:hypothetical protein DLAC_04927 [Tieghemostelium lacteum]|eukprot:KYQ93557.1 hypothetical protein DLAC_04927 [Tieghemostelium lacteum]